MITRQQYLNNEANHRQYYAQFVDDEIKNEVKRYIGIERIKASTDEHLNDIPMKNWDNMAGFYFNHNGEMIGKPNSIKKSLSDKFKATGEGLSAGTMVCIYKEAARQLIEKA